MLQTISQAEFHRRVKAVNRSLKWLALAAGVDPMTAYRGARRIETYNALERALVEEEQRLLKHLLPIHGCMLIDANVPGLRPAPASCPEVQAA